MSLSQAEIDEVVRVYRRGELNLLKAIWAYKAVWATEKDPIEIL